MMRCVSQRLGHRKGMVIASLNVNSLKLHLDEIKCLVNEKGIHILAVNKAKLNNEITDNLLEFEGYTLQSTQGGEKQESGWSCCVYAQFVKTQ